MESISTYLEDMLFAANCIGANLQEISISHLNYMRLVSELGAKVQFTEKGLLFEGPVDKVTITEYKQET